MVVVTLITIDEGGRRCESIRGPRLSISPVLDVIAACGDLSAPLLDGVRALEWIAMPGCRRGLTSRPY
jgi:hypothetical protein